MGRMRTLADKNLRGFFIYTTLVLLCCAPLLFFLMKHFYAEDLDELIIFRSDEFISKRLPLSQRRILTIGINTMKM